MVSRRTRQLLLCCTAWITFWIKQRLRKKAEFKQADITSFLWTRSEGTAAVLQLTLSCSWSCSVLLILELWNWMLYYCCCCFFLYRVSRLLFCCLHMLHLCLLLFPGSKRLSPCAALLFLPVLFSCFAFLCFHSSGSYLASCLFVFFKIWICDTTSPLMSICKANFALPAVCACAQPPLSTFFLAQKEHTHCLSNTGPTLHPKRFHRPSLA